MSDIGPTPDQPESDESRAVSKAVSRERRSTAFAIFAVPALASAFMLAHIIIMGGNTWIEPYLIAQIACFVIVGALAGRIASSRMVVLTMILALGFYLLMFGMCSREALHR
jgi:hypothetical protein